VEDDLNFIKMEDDLNFFPNGRRPQFFKIKTNAKPKLILGLAKLSKILFLLVLLYFYKFYYSFTSSIIFCPVLLYFVQLCSKIKK
jgi:hypothetical protein